MIRWLPPERGGRASTPMDGYRAAVRFEDARDRWPQEVWTLTLKCIQSFGDKREATVCDVEFLAPGAPFDLLLAGTRFELCEGRRVVAKGVFLPDEIAVPQQIDDFALSLLG